MGRRVQHRVWAVLLALALTVGLGAAPASASDSGQKANARNLETITVPLAAPAAVSPWTTGRITFCCGVPVGGYAGLTIRSDGYYRFYGHFHDSGAPSYNVNFVWLVGASDGTVFRFARSGRLAGTFEPGSRDYNWDRSGYSSSIRAHWPALKAKWRYRWSAQANWDITGSISKLITALKTAGQVVRRVVTIV